MSAECSISCNMSATRPSCAGIYSREVISPSLLKRFNSIPLNRPLNPKFDLGMSDWMDLRQTLHSVTRRTPVLPQLSARSYHLQYPTETRSGFPKQFLRTNLSRGFIPDNTAKNTEWATTVFSAWLESRNRRTGESTPTDYLDRSFATEESKVDLAHVLSLFVVEAKKKDGTSYPAKTVYHLLSGILRYMREKDPYAPNF